MSFCSDCKYYQEGYRELFDDVLFFEDCIFQSEGGDR